MTEPTAAQIDAAIMAWFATLDMRLSSSLLRTAIYRQGLEIQAARAESPLGYVRMVASLLPQNFEVQRGAANLSDEELLAIIQA